MAALSEPARPFLFGVGAAACLARDLRNRLSVCARRLDHPALRHLHPVFDLHRSRPDRDDPDVQRHVELVVDGLRPGNGQHAGADGQPVAALVPADGQAVGRSDRLGLTGLCLSGDRVDLGDRAAMVWLYRRTAGADPRRADAGRARSVVILRDPAVGEFCQCDEFVIFPMFFASSALYPLWHVKEASLWLYYVCQANPFTHAVELIRFALYAQLEPV